MSYQDLFSPAMFANKGESTNTNTQSVDMGDGIDSEVTIESMKLDADLATLNAAVERLEDLDVLMCTAAKFSGGSLHPDGAVFFVSQAEQLRRRISAPTEITASLESFSGGLADTADALDVSLASMGDTLRAGWDMVLKFIKDMIGKIKTFISLLGDKMPGLKTRAESLKEKANDTSGTAENSKIKIGGGFAVLAKDKTTLDFGLCGETLKALIGLKAPSMLVASVSKDKMEALDTTADALEKATGALIGFDPKMLVIGAAGGLPETTVKPGFGVDASKVEVETTKLLCGGKQFVYTYNKGATGSLEEALGVLASRRFALRSAEKDVKFDNDREVNTLAPAEVANACDVIISFAEEFEKSKGTIEAGRKEAENMVKLAEKLKTLSAKSDYSKVRGVLNKAKSAIQAQAQIAANPHRDVIVYGYQVANAVIAYGEKSLAQYK